MGKFGTFVEHLIVSIIWIAVVCAGVYFGGPLILNHLHDAQKALDALPSYQAATRADGAIASNAQRNCAAEVSAALKSGREIDHLSQPSDKGGMITSADIRNLTQ